MEMVQPSQFPIVDLSLLRQRHHDSHTNSIHQIYQACEKFGFFHIINHGISGSVIKEALDVNSQFFDTTKDQPLSVSADVFEAVRFGEMKGGEGEGEAQFLRNFLKLYANPIQDFLDLWPQNPPDFREKMGKYTLEVRKLCMEILEGIMESLGLCSTYMKQDLEQGVHIMWINSYPPSSQTNVKMGVLPHTDHGFITILIQEKPGLHIMDRVEGSWKTVPMIEQYSLVVHVGDYLEVLSNGAFKSVSHCAIPCSDETRLSISSFLCLAMDEVVEPAKELVDEKHPRKYKGSCFKDFLNHLKSREAKPFIETLKL